MVRTVCGMCGGKGMTGQTIVCQGCGGTGLVAGQDFGTGGIGGPIRRGPPLTGLLRTLGYVLFSGVILASLAAYHNTQGSGGDKAFTAFIILGILGATLFILLRLLQHPVSIALLAAAATGLDFALNGGEATRTALAYARGIIDQGVPWLTGLIFGRN